MDGAPTARLTGDDTANGAELHARASNGSSRRPAARRDSPGRHRAGGTPAARPAGCVADRSTVARLRRAVAPVGERGRRLTRESRVWRDRVTARSVSQADAAVYSPLVLRLRDQSWASGNHNPSWGSDLGHDQRSHPT